jgi:hypothetical protein
MMLCFPAFVAHHARLKLVMARSPALNRRHLPTATPASASRRAADRGEYRHAAGAESQNCARLYWGGKLAGRKRVQQAPGHDQKEKDSGGSPKLCRSPSWFCRCPLGRKGPDGILLTYLILTRQAMPPRSGAPINQQDAPFRLVLPIFGLLAGRSS